MYYFIEITNTTSGVAKAITEKETFREAEMQFHQTLASAIANSEVSSCMCMIVNGRDAVQRFEFWERGNSEVE